MKTVLYADIALPNAVRQVFTYGIPSELQENTRPGMRAWIPFGKRKAIGMVVRVHDRKPGFKVKMISELLDEEPLLPDELLSLTEWVSRYYFAGWGEVIQAALPAGLNYVAERFVSVLRRTNVSVKEKPVFDEIEQAGDLPLEDAEKRWGQHVIRRMIDRNILELREQPKVRVKPKLLKGLSWSEEVRKRILDDYTDETSPEAASDSDEKKSGDRKNRPLWKQELVRMMDFPAPVSRKELRDIHGFSDYVLNRIEKEGLLEIVELEVESGETMEFEHDPARLSSLNPDQQQALNRILEPVASKKFESFLLFGITGSGKTEVYIHALRQVMEQGRGGLILVPEIALTPQTVRRFYTVFGNQIAVLHSRLSDRERYEAWNALRRGDKKIAIGARSSVFAPVTDLGLIIMDEEHDHSYKQEDPAPRYNAREVALIRARNLNIPVVLGSATPSMGSLNASSRGKHIFLKLSVRHEKARLPNVDIIDLRQYRKAMRGPLSVALFEAVEERLRRREQVILLNNRRGFASYLQCEACGHVPECPHCSVSLTFHRSNQTLRCHYCGYSRRTEETCRQCDTDSFIQKGSGTQRNEDEIQEWFPEARVLRMDRDTTSGRDGHARILNAFGRHEADILVGTQLVSKGLDFPNVTLVGVINADTELAFPSYRSGERMFQLLTQVAGRAGRADKPGQVFLQTRMPEHPSLIHASKHDFEGFARFEMEQRKLLFYPPYSRLVQFMFKSNDPQLAAQAAESFTDILSRAIRPFLDKHRADGALPKFAVMGPAQATILKLYDDYRWESFLKIDPSLGTRIMEHFLSHVFEVYEKTRPAGVSSVRINVNVDA